MARRLLMNTIAFLQLARFLIEAQDWSCRKGIINIALIYDCRYNLQLQHNFFTEFLYKFNSVVWIGNKNQETTEHFSFNLFLKTYGSKEMVIFETLLKENFTEKRFSESILKINASSCPEHLPIANLFNGTRELFRDSQKRQRKFALFLFGQSIQNETSDYKVSQWLDDKQGLKTDIKRFFILINPKLSHTEIGLNSITINSLNDTRDVVRRSIAFICNPCHAGEKKYTHKHQCYFVLKGASTITRQKAKEICGKKMFKSQLVSLNTKSEYQYVTSLLKTELEDFIIDRENCLDGNLEHCKCLSSHIIKRKNGGFIRKFVCRKYKGKIKNVKHTIDVFIGLELRLNKHSDELIWDDGSPFVLDFDFSSYVYGQGCFSLSQSYNINYTSGSITLDDMQLITQECEELIKTYIILCESKIIDKQIKRITIHDLQKKGHSAYEQVLYQSFSLFLTSTIGYEGNNNTISKMKHKLTYTVTELEHMPICNTSEEILVTNIYNNSLSLNLVISNFCNSKGVHLCASYPLMCPKERDIIYNDNLHISKQWRATNSKDKVCLYETDSDRIRVWQLDTSHLQNCETFICPAGYLKCPDSYCIPAYLVDDGINDCPHGEDENVVNADTSNCQGKLKFTLKEFCLPEKFCKRKKDCLIYMNKFVCQSQCSSGYICLSNTIRENVDNNIKYKVSVIETTIKLYHDTNSFYFNPQIYFLFPLLNLIEIYLSKCMILNIQEVLENIDTSAVLNLDISRNDLSSKYNISALKKMKSLQKLNISYNQKLELNENYIFPSKLTELDLSFTKCGKGLLNYLVNLTQLKNLEMRNVEPIDLSKVSGKVKLDILDVRGTEIVNIKDGYLSWWDIGKALYTDDFRLCCDGIRGKDIPADTCHAPRDAISTCQDLIGDPIKRVILWVVGVLSLLGNLVVVIYRLLWDRAAFKTAYGLFVVCLAVSDFIMGVYLLIVAGADKWYRNLYVLNDTYWRHSNMCQLAGILSTFCSETSTIFICLITIDRYLLIQYPFGQHRFSKSGKITSICLTLAIGVVVSVIPAVFPGWEIYSTNGLCLALPFSAGRHGGWEYSAILFVGLNFVLFIIIAIGQIAIVRAIFFKEKKFPNKRVKLRKAQNLAVARQLFLVAMSDFCCWFPIGIMGIMSLNGYHFNPEVYAWSAVLILPVNSAINPLIYTLPIILNKIRSQKMESRMSLNESFKN